MPTSLRSFAKINLGLKIGPARRDRFHGLRTIYQTIAPHDIVRVEAQPGDGIEVRCSDPRVPCDSSNTCHKIAERVLNTAQKRAKIMIEIEKHLPVQGGMGAASSNAVAAMLALERELGVTLLPQDKLRIAAEVGSDLPLFLIGGTILGVGRGEEVYPLLDLPELHLIVVAPPIGVSTPKAFAKWDTLVARETQLTGPEAAGTMNEFSRSVHAWLGKYLPQRFGAGEPASGVPAACGDRAETLLLDLVRAGIENDFERVVFPEYPELREVKALLVREGARYASLSGSGSALYGLFDSAEKAGVAAERMAKAGHAAAATLTVSRKDYWQQIGLG